MWEKRHCIFCNEEVNDKTKEHVIPQWLIKKTGKPNRKIRIGLDYSPIFNPSKEFKKNPIQFSFNNFTFPACQSCNNYYSKMEKEMEEILRKIENNDSLNNQEVRLMLDWFDKVRVGLWYGMCYLQKPNFLPKFGISQRIGYYDRMLIVVKNPIYDDGINFLGTGTPSFLHIQSAFGLRINKFLFYSVSKMELLSEGLGYPFLETVMANDGNQIASSTRLGTHKPRYNKIKNVIPPLLRNGVVFMQPILPESNVDGIVINERKSGEVFISTKPYELLKMNGNFTLWAPIVAQLNENETTIIDMNYVAIQAMEVQNAGIRDVLATNIIPDHTRVELEYVMKINENIKKKL